MCARDCRSVCALIRVTSCKQYYRVDLAYCHIWGLVREEKKIAYKETGLLRELEQFLGLKYRGYDTAVTLRTLDNETRVFGTTANYSLVPVVDNRHPVKIQIVVSVSLLLCAFIADY